MAFVLGVLTATFVGSQVTDLTTAETFKELEKFMQSNQKSCIRNVFYTELYLRTEIPANTG